MKEVSYVLTEKVFLEYPQLCWMFAGYSFSEGCICSRYSLSQKKFCYKIYKKPKKYQILGKARLIVV